MARLLETRLPLAVGDEVKGETFNKLIRTLELNLDTFDTNATPAFLVANRDELKFTKGDVIWNLNENVLQVWSGTLWENISTPETSGLSCTGSVGTVQVTNGGAITVVVD